jgi:hypothetical protein
MSSFKRALMAIAALAASVVPASSSASVPYPTHEFVGRLEVSTDAGLGRLEIHGKLAAVLQRDEGVVSLVDLKDPAHLKILGQYEDDARQSFDGDLAFSSDGKWLFYARQTHQFSLDGIHVIDVSDPSAPTLRSYQPGGGALRIGYFDDGTDQWVVVLDATTGMVVYRFEPATGVLVPVHVNALPALKVGGPASAGVVIQRDPILKKPLLYAATGATGVEVFDFSDPTNPTLLGSWGDLGLAEIEVSFVHGQRTILAATEYWFDKTIPPAVMVLDASKLDKIEMTKVLTLTCPADDDHRVQGLAVVGRNVYVAHSSAGLPMFLDATDPDRFRGTPLRHATHNAGAGVPGDTYVFDVEVAGDLIFSTDAANGYLSVMRRISVRRAMDNDDLGLAGSGDPC